VEGKSHHGKPGGVFQMHQRRTRRRILRQPQGGGLPVRTLLGNDLDRDAAGSTRPAAVQDLLLVDLLIHNTYGAASQTFGQSLTNGGVDDRTGREIIALVFADEKVRFAKTDVDYGAAAGAATRLRRGGRANGCAGIILKEELVVDET